MRRLRLVLSVAFTVSFSIAWLNAQDYWFTIDRIEGTVTASDSLQRNPARHAWTQFSARARTMLALKDDSGRSWLCLEPAKVDTDKGTLFSAYEIQNSAGAMTISAPLGFKIAEGDTATVPITTGGKFKIEIAKFNKEKVSSIEDVKAPGFRCEQVPKLKTPLGKSGGGMCCLYCKSLLVCTPTTNYIKTDCGPCRESPRLF